MSPRRNEKYCAFYMSSNTGLLSLGEVRTMLSVSKCKTRKIKSTVVTVMLDLALLIKSLRQRKIYSQITELFSFIFIFIIKKNHLIIGLWKKSVTAPISCIPDVNIYCR
jgi:hypothetical protein